ncbi:hypothetical protein Hanom_Chr05g00473811 [Helianthus anomalus]
MHHTTTSNNKSPTKLTIPVRRFDSKRIHLKQITPSVNQFLNRLTIDTVKSESIPITFVFRFLHHTTRTSSRSNHHKRRPFHRHTIR